MSFWFWSWVSVPLLNAAAAVTDQNDTRLRLRFGFNLYPLIDICVAATATILANFCSYISYSFPVGLLDVFFEV